MSPVLQTSYTGRQQNPAASASNNTPLQQPIATASTQAQYTPIPPGTVTTLRQTIGTGNALKSKSSGPTHPLPPTLDVTKFHVRVAHAKYSGTPPVTTWTVFNDGWFVAINNNTPVTFEALKETFGAKGQAQYIDYLNNNTGPQGRGYWTLSTNHLAANNPAPQIWCTWEGAYRIQGAVLMKGYPPPPGANGKAGAGISTYPMTLLWYPRIRPDSDSWRLSSFGWATAEESLLPAKGSSPEYQRYSSPPGHPTASAAAPPEALLAPSTSVKTAANGKAKEAHKRQISQEIPRNKRDNGELSPPKAAPANSRYSGKHPGRHLGGHPQVSARASQKSAIRIAAIASVHVNYTTQSRVTLIYYIAHQLLVNLVTRAVLAMFAKEALAPISGWAATIPRY
jgi:hypothetical protein